MNTTGSRSVSHSRVGSHAGSSSSSPGLQVRGRRLPEDEMNVAYDPRLEAPSVLYNPPRMNSRVSERNPYYHPTFPHPPADIAPHHFRSPPMAPTIDAPLHPARLSPLPPAIRHPYALPIQSYTNSIPGHTSPTYASSRPPSGAGTPPYTVYSPYPAPYGYSHSHIPWDGYVPPIHPYPGYSSPLQDEYNAPLPAHLSFFNPHLTSVAEPSPNTHVTQTLRSPEGSQDLQSLPATVTRNMVFGSIGLSHDGVDQTLNGNAAADEEGVEKLVERVVDQFSGFAIGVTPGEPGPFRQGNRKHSTKSLSGPSATPVAESADNTNTINDTPQEGPRVTDERPVHDIAVPGKKWKFGTITRCDNEDHRMGGSRDTSSECLPLPAGPSQRPGHPPGQHLPDATTETQPTGSEQPATPPIDTSQAGPSILNSEDGSATSDVWEVKDYGYGFGDVSGTDNATDIIRRAMEIREKQRRLEWEKEHMQKQLQMQQEQQSEAQEEHTWQEAPDEGEGWDQVRDFGRGRPRRGSWASSYGPHERGSYGGRRGRGFSGRYQGRYPGRGGHHYQQPSISLTPPPQFNPLPLPGVDYLSGYVPQMPSYTPPDYELYHPVPATIPVNGGPPIPMPQSALPFPLDPTRSYLLGQLEYYLSPQNMVQDFFLRQRVSSIVDGNPILVVTCCTDG
jgi:la-related protein 1